MNRLYQTLCCIISCLILSPSSWAGETRSAIEGQAPPAASIEGLSWLAGEWIGEGIGGAEAREAYSAPTGGAIIGHFVQTDDKGGVQFYELMQIAPMQDSLILRIKHFTSELTGWEEKAEVVEFPLVAHEGDSWYFDGLTIRRDGTDGLVSAVSASMKDGSSKELVFRYKRAE